MWGAETTINFVTQRRSPSRFVYQYPLYMPGYHSAQIVQEFYADLKAKRPIVIVDTSSTNPLIPPIDAEKRRIWSNHTPDGLLVEMKTVFDYISSNYRQVRTLGKETWSVYMLSERALETPSDNR
jgi:hypothetical protein